MVEKPRQATSLLSAGISWLGPSKPTEFFSDGLRFFAVRHHAGNYMLDHAK